MTQPAADPGALTPGQIAQLLAVGGANGITEDMILEDIKMGAPVKDDGTMSLIDYTAWMVKENRA